MHLRITGFFPEPNEDDSMQFKQVLQQGQEPDVLAIMGWASVDAAAGGESELTPEQTKKISELLNEPSITGLTLFISRRA
ncbi:MAG: pyocin S6 family toxin immunity protein [Pseudomonas sp.]